MDILEIILSHSIFSVHYDVIPSFLELLDLECRQTGIDEDGVYVSLFLDVHAELIQLSFREEIGGRDLSAPDQTAPGHGLSQVCISPLILVLLVLVFIEVQDDTTFIEDAIHRWPISWPVNIVAIRNLLHLELLLVILDAEGPILSILESFTQLFSLMIRLFI